MIWESLESKRRSDWDDLPDLAGQAVGGGLGDHGGPPGGGLPVVDNTGELLALVKLYPLNVHFAS